MGQFFRGSKRKIGVVTLMMACVSTAAWIRGSFVSDYFENGNVGENSIVIENSNGLLGLMIVTGKPYTKPSISQPYSKWNTEDTHKAGGHSLNFQRTRQNVRFKVLGFAGYLGKINTNVGPITFNLFEIELMILMIPLTLISLWLLLSKPRKSTPKKTSDAIPIEEV